MHEWLLVGLRASTRTALGNADAEGNLRANPKGTTQWDLRQEAFSTLRASSRGQVGVLVPLVESFRDSATTDAESSVGLGDVEFNARWDFLHASEVPRAAGVALLARAITPTGTAAEAATKPLGSDATGLGAAQFELGVALERAYRAWLFNLLGEIGQRLSRDVSGIETTPGLRWGATLGIGYAWSHRTTTAFVTSIVGEGNSVVDGAQVAHSATRSVDLAFAATHSPNNDWRLRTAFSLQPPIDGLAKNSPLTAGLSLSVVRSFW